MAWNYKNKIKGINFAEKRKKSHEDYVTSSKKRRAQTFSPLLLSLVVCCQRFLLTKFHAENNWRQSRVND
jgi:hypothetical protein